jgi:hypothetical protein
MSDQHIIEGNEASSKSLANRTPKFRVNHRHRRLLDQMAGRAPKWKRAYAQKHGVFAACPTIPGEDPREFKELHSDLIAEWQPSGRTERDAVLSLADLMWRKIRAQKYLQIVLMINSFDSRSPFFDEAYGLCNFLFELRTQPELAFEKAADHSLHPDKIKYLNEKFPRSSYQSTSEWAQAVIDEIETVLLPAIPRLEAPAKWEKVEFGFGEMLTSAAEAQTAAVVTHAKDLLEDELNLRERLEAMIERKVKHLIQLKAMKQMLRQTCALREDEPPKRIALPSPPTPDATDQ